MRGNTVMASDQHSTVKKCLYCGNSYIGFGQARYCNRICRERAHTVRRGGTPTNRTRPHRAIVVDGKKQCKRCNEWLHLDKFRAIKDKRVNNYYRRSECHECEKKRLEVLKKGRTYESRIEERKRAAWRKGKDYFPNGRKPIDDLYSESLVARNARDAFNWWFEKKTQDEKDAWYEASGKPWNNPRFSKSEKFNIRYRLDNEFNTYQKTRRQLKKYLYEDGIGDIIRSGIINSGKSRKVEDMLGYTISDITKHIEKQFTKGMTWDKFRNGDIHIDHIIPKAEFDLTDIKEWRTCWGLPNLRPLWAKDNRAKSAKVMTLL